MKMKNNLIQFNKWNEYSIDISNNLLTKNKLINSFDNFWYHIIKYDLRSNHVILCQLKIKTENNIYRNISDVLTATKNEKLDLLEMLIAFLEMKSDNYKGFPITNVIFNYKIIDSLEDIKLINNKGKRKNIIRNNMKPVYHIGGYNLPNTMDITSWGNCLFSHKYTRAQITKTNSKIVYDVSIYDNYNLIEMKYKDRTLLEFKDIMMDHGNLNYFHRIIEDGKHEYYFENGEIVLRKVIRKVKFLETILKSPFRSYNFITMDLETRLCNNIMSPYAISIFDGKITTSFYLSDYMSSEQMLMGAIQYLMKRKYNNYKIYCHNFSNFDAVFLLRILTQCSDKIKPVIRDGRIIDIKFSFGKEYNLYFRDSYLLLPASLRDLARNFKVEDKGIFPYRFVTDNTELDYKGSVPSFSYFDGLSIEEYENYKKEYQNKEWSLKCETIKYCEQDVHTLYQILDVFSKKIYSLFRIDLFKYPTLSSLAFAIYRSNFLKKDMNIPLINGELFNFFKLGYTGGSVDVYKPQGEKVYRYDVNSLYPYVMEVCDMPTDNPTYFEGDILKFDPKPYGFFEVEINTPDEMDIPLLQLRFKTKEGSKTIAPLGKWKGVYFSEELFNAQKYGYSFKILRGYLFQKKNLFKKYVNTLYELKVNSKKGSPDYIISKLLLNNLYGRLGMNPEMENHIICPYKDEIKYIANDNYKVSNIQDLNNGKLLLSYYETQNKDYDKPLNISIVVSSAVTANARIYMTYFKTRKDFQLFYVDTDSIDINKALDDKYVGEKLGQMKLEHIFDKSLYLAPKVYAGITSNYEVVKAKGVKVDVEYKQLEPLLFKNASLSIDQEKWYKDISHGQIKCINELYHLMVTESKRKLIYDENNKLINTKPLIINNDTILN
jgi:hypothetical protein